MEVFKKNIDQFKLKKQANWIHEKYISSMLFLKERNIFITSGGDASIKFFAGIKG